MGLAVRLGVLLMAMMLGCNCTATQPKLISLEPTIARVPIPEPPPPPSNLECKSPTVLARARRLAPTIGFIFTNAPDDGVEQLDSLAMGMGTESVCCAALLALGVLKSIKQTEVDIDMDASKQRIAGYVFSRCFTKSAYEGGEAI